MKIELQGVCKSYYSESTVTQALRKVDLTLETGEFVAITGESGSGKSTLLHLIGGLDTFDEGEMLVDGEATFPYDEEDWEEYRRTKIGYVFQDYNLIGHYSVVDNIVSALLIMGRSREEAEARALEYIEKVGLKEYAAHKANELSSGQKQRLSIARALAKETPVIVADEPTGNLDRETGDSIIRLLKELSADRLVVMVTHNYDQAEPYVTRRIRLFDGVIVSDVAVNRREPQKYDEIVTSVAKDSFPRRHELARFFVGKNYRNRIGKNILFTVFLFFISFVSLAFISELFLHRDDALTKIYDTTAFAREDTTRLVVRKKDGSAISEVELDKIRRLGMVAAADSCDYCNDINFYMLKDVDYTITYGKRGPFTWGLATVNLDNKTRFMMSANAITEKDLAAGRLPENEWEIVLWAADSSALGSSYTTYFDNKNLWGKDEYCQAELKVVGILKQETTQVYFSEALCRMLGMHMDSGLYRIYYAYSNKTMDYTQKPEVIPIINPELKGNEIIASSKLGTLPAYGETPFVFAERDSSGKLTGNTIEETVRVTGYSDEFTSKFIQVSREFYDKYYTAETRQVSVYLVSYAKTDSAIRKLSKMGYSAVSTFRTGVTNYKSSKVSERLTIMGICGLGLVILLVVEYLILRALLKLEIKNCNLLKFIGMRFSTMKLMNYFEIFGYCTVALLLSVLVALILKIAGIEAVTELFYYMTPAAWLVFVAYNFVLAALAVAGFNRLLRGRLQV